MKERIIRFNWGTKRENIYIYREKKWPKTGAFAAAHTCIPQYREYPPPHPTLPHPTPPRDQQSTRTANSDRSERRQTPPGHDARERAKQSQQRVDQPRSRQVECFNCGRKIIGHYARQCRQPPSKQRLLGTS